MLTGFMADKPKGGRGKKAPYETKQMRIPQPLWTQVEVLCDRYQEFIAAGGAPANPPFFMERAIVAPIAEQRHAETTGDRHLTEGTSEPPVEVKPTKYQQLWEELNLRQQTYLRLIFETDQQREVANRSGDWRRGGREPASQWRWIEYAELFGVSTPFRQLVKEAGVVDPGTGSTFKALATRELIQVRYPYDDFQWLDCKLTKQGRAVARAGLGLVAPKKPPVGQLKERQWAALAAAYAVGFQGVKKDENLNYGGFSWESTWLRLRDYIDGTLIKERSGFVGGRYEHDLAITQFGRHFYRCNWEKYRELYPNVDAPKPTREAPADLLE